MEAQRCGLHWLTFTTPDHSVEDVLDRMGGASSRVEPIGGYGHPSSIMHESGARIFFGSRRRDQPVCVNLTGEVCESWAADGIAWAEDLGGVCTRADLAVDLDPPELARGRMIELRRCWKSGKVDTRIGKFEEHRSEPPDGWTWYFGGKGAEKRLRVYDRRGPLRLEWQWRPEKETGRIVPYTLARRGTGYVWRSLAQQLKFPSVPWYQQLLDGDAAQFGPAVREESLLLKVIEQLQVQLGGTLWALSELGVTMDELAKAPPSPMRGDLAAKMLRWADDADDEGYDGGQLRREVLCRLKSRQSSSSPTAAPAH